MTAPRASLFVIGLPRSGSSHAYVQAASMLGLRQPSWTSDGEILNLDRYTAWRSTEPDGCAKFTSREADPVLFDSITELLDTAVRRRGFAYKDVIQPLVVSSWKGLRDLRVLRVRRDLAEVACAMLRQGWVYPAVLGGHRGDRAAGPLAPLEVMVEGLLVADRALERVPGARIEFDELLESPEALASVLSDLYPDLREAAMPSLTSSALAASRSHREELRKAPEYLVLRGLIDHARGSSPRFGASRRNRRPWRRVSVRNGWSRGSGLTIFSPYSFSFPILASCPGCTLTADRSAFARADAILFHIPTTPNPIPLIKAPGQRWIVCSLESEVNYPQLTDPVFMGQFDLTMTYRRDSDIVLTYCRPEHWLPFTCPQLATERERSPAVYFASNTSECSGRTDYVRELMRWMPVDSFGRSLNNRQLVDDKGRATKLSTISRYRFTLAFENSIALNYVTEKFYDPLRAGSVPVYLGAPDIADYAPARGCYIDVRDFSGPAALAEHLLALSADEARYAQHFAWHEKPLASGFLAMVEEQREPAMCRLCRVLRDQ